MMGAYIEMDGKLAPHAIVRLKSMPYSRDYIMTYSRDCFSGLLIMRWATNIICIAHILIMTLEHKIN